MGGLLIFIVVVLALALYLLPSLIAEHRETQHRNIIFVANVILGWSGIVWVVLLIWAFLDDERWNRHV